MSEQNFAAASTIQPGTRDWATEMRDRIERKLTEGLAPAVLTIRDDSHRHAGHAGARPGGGTHFHVVIVCDAFQGQSRVARQRTVFALLKSELEERVHALSLETRTPGEWAARQG